MVLTSQLIMAHLGHPVKLVNTFGELNGTLFAFGTETLQLTSDGHSFRLSEWAVFTEKPPAPLPTKPGAVISGGGHVSILGKNGQWRADDTLGGVSDEGIREYFPEFVVMRPEAEVAAEFGAELIKFFSRVGGGFTSYENDVKLLVAEWAAR